MLLLNLTIPRQIYYTLFTVQKQSIFRSYEAMMPLPESQVGLPPLGPESTIFMDLSVACHWPIFVNRNH